MFIIKNNDIEMTKGDSGCFDITLKNGDGTAFEEESGDEIIFSVRKKKESFYPVVIKKNGVKIALEAKDTESMDSGEYDYDVVVARVNGNRQTVIEGKFIVRKAVHGFE